MAARSCFKRGHLSRLRRDLDKVQREEAKPLHEAGEKYEKVYNLAEEDASTAKTRLP